MAEGNTLTMIASNVLKTNMELALLVGIHPEDDGDIVHTPTGDWRKDAPGIWRFFVAFEDEPETT